MWYSAACTRLWRGRAGGASSLWIPQIFGGADVLDELGGDGGARPDVKPFSTAIFYCGGAGTRPGEDGLNVTAFPSGVRTIPVEATEAVAPVIFRRREFREGSGGAGQFRGGFDQVALDVADGLVSRDTAEREYRVALAGEGGVEHAATARLRATAVRA